MANRIMSVVSDDPVLPGPLLKRVRRHVTILEWYRHNYLTESRRTESDPPIPPEIANQCINVASALENAEAMLNRLAIMIKEHEAAQSVETEMEVQDA